MNKIEWNKAESPKCTKRYISINEKYAIVGRYTYYWGYESCYLPNGLKGEWIDLDGMYKGKGALNICREICQEHADKNKIR